MATCCALAQPLCQGICECKQARLQAAVKGRGLLGTRKRLPSQMVFSCLLLQPPLPLPVPLPCVRRQDFSAPARDAEQSHIAERCPYLPPGLPGQGTPLQGPPLSCTSWQPNMGILTCGDYL